ncbi:unnamed protein product [marine sediment metagenome]|uniref:Uncharacterized protein n=1 Tax=marine sediment metagenome TaxID=412755 RepID=X0T6A8_9ZZZZ
MDSITVKSGRLIRKQEDRWITVRGKKVKITPRKLGAPAASEAAQEIVQLTQRDVAIDDEKATIYNQMTQVGIQSPEHGKLLAEYEELTEEARVGGIRIRELTPTVDQAEVVRLLGEGNK